MLHELIHLPCLYCHPHSYIRMVQHLIERCLILNKSLSDYIIAFAERASIQPIITSTVRKELQKEKDFFYSYFHDNSQRQNFDGDSIHLDAFFNYIRTHVANTQTVRIPT